MKKRRIGVIFEVIALIVVAIVFVKVSWPRYNKFVEYMSVSNANKEWFDLYSQSKVLREQGKTDEALELLHEAVTHKGIDGKVYLMLAVVYMDKREYQEAEEYYKLALQHGMKNPVNKYITLNNLGDLYHDKYSDYDQAIDYFKKAFAMRPGKEEPWTNDVDPVTGLIWSYVHNNQYEIAKKFLEKKQCDSHYCKWLQKVPRPPEYRSLKGMNVLTKIYYDSNGKVTREMQKRKDGERHGFFRVYNENGMLVVDEYYKDGNKDGVQRLYGENGALSHEFVFKEGKLLDEQGGLFSRIKEFVVEFPVKNRVKSNFVEGFLDGVTQVYNEDGVLNSEAMFIEGEIEKIKTYHENGKLYRESDILVKNGVQSREYYENGQISKEIHVKDGKMVNIKYFDEEGNYTGDFMNPTVESVQIVRYGFVHDIKERMKKLKSQSDAPVCLLSNTMVFDVETEMVPARLNVEFGFAFKVKGAPEEGFAQVVTRFTHPPLTNPQTGETTTIDERERTVLLNKMSHAGWVFECPWEVVPGKWKIEILHEGKQLVEKIFTVE